MCCVEDIPHGCLVKFKLSCTVPYCHLTNVIWQKVPVHNYSFANRRSFYY